MGFIYVFEYLAGLFAFGFVYLILDDVINALKVVSSSGNTYDLGLYIWAGIVILYIINGAIWLWKKYTAPQYQYWEGN